MTKRPSTDRPREPRKRRTRGRAVERRRNVQLREVMDELIQHVRALSGGIGSMTPDQVEYAQQRLEWLADEAWRLVIDAGEA